MRIRVVTLLDILIRATDGYPRGKRTTVSVHIGRMASSEVLELVSLSGRIFGLRSAIAWIRPIWMRSPTPGREPLLAKEATSDGDDLRCARVSITVGQRTRSALKRSRQWVAPASRLTRPLLEDFRNSENSPV